MSFRKYDENGVQIRKRSVIQCTQEEGKTEQTHVQDVDINNIIKKHGADYIKKINGLREWVYDDVTGNDFQESMNAIIKARETFADVPLQIRKQFDHDPIKMLDFVRNPANADRLVEMGLAHPPPPADKPIEVVVTNPEAPPPG